METRTVTLKEMDREDFGRFGECEDILHPSGYCLEGTYHKFYRDMVHFPGVQSAFCYSSLQVRRNDEFLVCGMEYHDHTAEVQMPLDQDAVLVCAPANGGELRAEEVEAFKIPKGTMVVLYAGTWHDVLYPVSAEEVTVLIGLPERVYHNDIVVKEFQDVAVKVKL